MVTVMMVTVTAMVTRVIPRPAMRARARPTPPAAGTTLPPRPRPRRAKRPQRRETKLERLQRARNEAHGAEAPGAARKKKEIGAGLTVEQHRELIAQISSEIMAAPQESFRRLSDLTAIAGNLALPSVSRKLAILSLCALFKDLIPDYRIRETTDAEKAVKLSKEVKKLHDFEQGLLSRYQAYLATLDELVKSLPAFDPSLDEAGQERMVLAHIGCTSLRALCELLSAHPHFNFRTNIVHVIVPRAASPFDCISKLCCGGMTAVFRADPDGESTLEVVRLLGESLKRRGFRARPEALDTLLHLRPSLLERASEAFSKSKMERKRENRKRKRLLKGITEVDEAAERDRQAKTSAKILDAVFVTYFRIVKNAPRSPLLPAVLRGLGKHSHMINVEFLGDLISALQTVVENNPTLGVEGTLNCAISAFSTLTGQGQV